MLVPSAQRRPPGPLGSSLPPPLGGKGESWRENKQPQEMDKIGVKPPGKGLMLQDRKLQELQKLQHPELLCSDSSRDFRAVPENTPATGWFGLEKTFQIPRVSHEPAPTPCSAPNQALQCHIHSFLEHFQGWGLLLSLGQPFPGLGRSFHEEISPDIQSE